MYEDRGALRSTSERYTRTYKDIQGQIYKDIQGHTKTYDIGNGHKDYHTAQTVPSSRTKTECLPPPAKLLQQKSLSELGTL
jgi:hypothetical protein